MSEKHANALAKEQAKANTEAAKHPSMFVAGARPAIMWVCAIGLFVNFFIKNPINAVPNLDEVAKIES